MIASNSCAIVFAGTGQRHFDEAKIAAASVRRHNMEPVLLVTDLAQTDSIFDKVIQAASEFSGYGSKLAMRHCPFDRFIYLDSDCRVIGSLGELFQLLDVFDLALPAALGGYHYQLEGCSPAFREHATNVIAVRQGQATDVFFDSWARWYRHYENEMMAEGDQRSFRRAAYETTPLRLCTLGDEWSLSPYPGGLLCADVKIVHGRPSTRLDFLERHANRKLGYRVILPPFAPIYPPSSMAFGDWARLISSECVEIVKAVARLFRGLLKKTRNEENT